MISTRKAYLLGGSAIALATLGLAIAGAVPHTHLVARTAPRAAAAVSAAAAAPPAEAAPRGAAVRQWPVGSAFVYAMESARTVSMTDGAPKGTSASTLAGDLAIAVVAEGPSAVRLRLALRAPRHVDAPGRPLDDAELTRAFYADAAPDGHFQGFAFQRGVSARTRRELKALVAALQLVDAPASTTWRATELDGAGEYLASYQRTGGAIHKSKERYERTMGSRGLTVPGSGPRLTVSSSADFTLSSSAWPETVSSDETVGVDSTGLRISARTLTKAVLVAVEHLPGLAAKAAAEAGSLASDAPDAEGFAQARRRADEDRVRGASYETLVGDLRAADAPTQNEALSRTAALFRLQPGDAAKAADTVLEGDLDEGATGRLLGALGGAGTKQAQEALATVLSSSSASPATRSAAAASLGMTATPTTESEDALISAMASPDDSVARTASLGAGNLVKRMNAAGSGSPSPAIEALTTKLSGATTDDERTFCLQALGNTGDARALGAVERHLAHESPGVRAAAAYALRFMNGTDVDLTMAMKDADVSVRRAAVDTLAFRPITPILGAVDGLLRSDLDTTLRLGIVKAMQVRRDQDPAVAGSLAWAAAHDPSGKVQKAAQSALAVSR